MFLIFFISLYESVVAMKPSVSCKGIRGSGSYRAAAKLQ